VRREKKSVSRSSPVSGYTISAVYQRGDRGCRHLDLTRSTRLPSFRRHYIKPYLKRTFQDYCIAFAPTQ